MFHKTVVESALAADHKQVGCIEGLWERLRFGLVGPGDGICLSEPMFLSTAAKGTLKQHQSRNERLREKAEWPHGAKVVEPPCLAARSVNWRGAWTPDPQPVRCVRDYTNGGFRPGLTAARER